MVLTDSERSDVEVLCDRVLRAVEQAQPHVARSFNARLEYYGLGTLDGLDRKVGKLLVLQREQRALLRTIVGSIKGEKSPVNCFYLLDQWAGRALNPFGELTGGNFRYL